MKWGQSLQGSSASITSTLSTNFDIKRAPELRRAANWAPRDLSSSVNTRSAVFATNASQITYLLGALVHSRYKVGGLGNWVSGKRGRGKTSWNKNPVWIYLVFLCFPSIAAVSLRDYIKAFVVESYFWWDYCGAFFEGRIGQIWLS